MPGIHYNEKGSGFPVILIHGFCENLFIWKEVLNQLPDEFRFIALDLPGFGQSQAIESPHSIDDIADKLLEFIEIAKLIHASPSDTVLAAMSCWPWPISNLIYFPA